MAKDKKKPKEYKSMKGASSTQKKERALAVDRSRSVAFARSRVDEDSGSGEHGSRPHTSGTPGRASADPVSASPVRQRTGDSSKESTGSGVRVMRMSDKPDIQDSRGSLNPSSGSGMSEFSGFSSVNDIPPFQSNLLLPDRSDGESSDETVTGYFVSIEKSFGETVRLASSIGLVPDSLVYPYTLANPDRLTNPDGRFLSDSRLNPDSQT